MKLWAWFLVCEDGGAAPSVSSPLGAQFASAKEPTAASFICGTPACCAAAVSTGLQSLPPLPPLLPPLVATTTTTITSASAAADPTMT